MFTKKLPRSRFTITRKSKGVFQLTSEFFFKWLSKHEARYMQVVLPYIIRSYNMRPIEYILITALIIKEL